MDVKKNGGKMNKIFVIGVVATLLSSTLLPAVVGDDNKDVNEKITVRVRTSLGTMIEREVPFAVGEKLQSIIEQFINHTDRYKMLLPILMDILEEYGLIKNAEKIESMIKSNLENKNYQIVQQLQSRFFNLLCFVAGYGLDSSLFTPGLFLTFLFLITLAEKIEKIFPSINIDIDPLLNLTCLINTFRSRVFIPIAQWLVVRGGFHTIGLLGYRHYYRNNEDGNNALGYPKGFLVIGFTGIWISFLFKLKPRQYFIGSAIAII